jgi:hypothetical protein
MSCGVLAVLSNDVAISETLQSLSNVLTGHWQDERWYLFFGQGLAAHLRVANKHIWVARRLLYAPP